MADEVDIERLHAELYEAAGAGRRLGEEIAARTGHTQAQWQTLWTIRTGPLTVPQIARRLGVSRQHILRLANELTRQGLIEAVENPDHRTSRLLRLTGAGEEVLDEINARASASNRRLLEELTAGDVAELRALLRRFTAIVKSTELGDSQ